MKELDAEGIFVSLLAQLAESYQVINHSHSGREIPLDWAQAACTWALAKTERGTSSSFRCVKELCYHFLLTPTPRTVCPLRLEGGDEVSHDNEVNWTASTCWTPGWAESGKETHFTLEGGWVWWIPSAVHFIGLDRRSVIWGIASIRLAAVPIFWAFSWLLVDAGEPSPQGEC